MGCSACCTTNGEKDQQVSTILNESTHLVVDPVDGGKRKENDESKDDEDNKSVLVTDLPYGCKY